jgi:hypothetical protein
VNGREKATVEYHHLEINTFYKNQFDREMYESCKRKEKNQLLLGLLDDI